MRGTNYWDARESWQLLQKENVMRSVLAILLPMLLLIAVWNRSHNAHAQEASESAETAPAPETAAPAPSPENAAPAPSGSATTSDTDELWQTLKDMFAAGKNREWALAGIMAVILLTQLLRAGAVRASKFSWLSAFKVFSTKWGGWALTTMTTFALALLTAVKTDTALSGAFLLSTLLQAVAASGGFEFLKDSKLMKSKTAGA